MVGGSEFSEFLSKASGIEPSLLSSLPGHRKCECDREVNSRENSTNVENVRSM
jgi:hypothetical protein